MLRYYSVFNLFLLVAGLGISGFLLIIYTSDTALPCTLSHGCDTVRYSPYAKMFGLPIPLYGVGFYICAIGLSILIMTSRRLVYLFGLWVLTVWGVIFAGYLTYLEAFVIHAWCSWCVMNAFVNVMSFVVTTIIFVRTVKNNTILGILVS